MGTGGGAVAADPFSGNILFYTDGANVYDVTNTVMPNGTGLNANTANNQAVAVGAVPGQVQVNQYYIFTNTAAGTIAYTIVDMAQPGNAVSPTPALGDVTATKNVAIPGLTNRLGAMTLIPHSNGTDYWLVTQETGTSNYAVTLIDATGNFDTTVYAGAGFSMTAANLAYNEAAGQIAVSPQTTNVDIHLLNFDNTTGVIGFNQTIPNTAVPTSSGQAIYDVEWSSNGQYLYISVAGGAGIQADVLQFDLLNPTTTLASVLPQPNGVFASYGLQMGPDSTIYHLYQETAGGPYLLGGISDTDSVAAKVIYAEEIFAGDFGGGQFPSFLPQLDQDITISFTSAGTCANTPTSFFPEVRPGADSLVWDFGDGGGSNSWSPVYTYEDGGDYTVTVTAHFNGQTETATETITIQPFDVQIQLVQDTTACSCELPFPRATNPKPPCGQFSVTATVEGTYTSAIWSDSHETTGLTLQPDSAGYYYLVVTDAAGCSTYAGVNIREYDVQDQRANIWYFGQNAGIDFNPMPEDPPVGIPGPVNSPEGVAVISDRNGQAVFSTDGEHVYNKDGVDVAPASIGGSPGSTQSAIIIPVPGDETLYYIFTTKEVYGDGTYEVHYSLYDSKMNNNTGGLIEYDQYLFGPSTERLTGNGNWLIAHEFGNNSFRAYEITSNGISTPVISGVGSDHSIAIAENAQGYMKLGPGNKLAVALSTPGVSNVIEVFDFNDSTGVVSNPQVANLNNTNGQVYGIEFSPAGNKLFATLSGTTTSEIYEFAFDSLGNVYQKQPPPTNSFSEQLGAMQIGPDGQIYVASNGKPYLYFFQPAEDTLQKTPLTFQILENQQFTLTGTSTLGLPNFIQNISSPVQGPTISASGNCLGDSTIFNATGRDPNIEFYQWNFGDGQGTAASNDPAAQHLYAAAGTYTVALTLSNRCDQDTILYTTVVITAPPAPPTILQPGVFPVLCTGQLTLEATPSTNPNLSNLNFIWTTGDTTRQITVNQRGNYGVTIVDNFGCSSNGSLIIADNRPMVELGPDLTLCQNTPVFPLNAQNPGASYQWEILQMPSGTPQPNAGTSQTQSVDTSVPGVFEYKVEVTDPITTCSVRDSVTFTFNQSPVFTATPFDATACGAGDGRIELNITAPATSLFTYSVTGPSPGISAIDQPANPLPSAPYIATPLTTGVYGITVSDQISGCYTITTASINDNAFALNLTQIQTCDPISINVELVSGTPTFPVAYTVTSSSFQVVDTGNGFNAFPFPTNAVSSNNQTYTVNVTDALGCSNSETVTIQQGPQVDINDLTPDGCSNPITLNVSGSGTTTWTWSGPGITGSLTGSSVQVTPPQQGVLTYNLRGTHATLCAIDTTVLVNVDNMVIPAISQSDPCADQVTVTATPNGSYLYRWYNNSGLDNSLGGNAPVLSQSYNGQRLYVQLYNPLSGCTSPASNNLDISIVGELDLTLTTTPACEGDDFIITGTTNQPVPSYVWSYEGSVINGQTSSTLLDTRAGEYKAVVSLSGCTDTDSITILLSPITPGSLVSRAVICNDPANSDPNTNQVVLDPGAGFDSYAWFRNGVALGVTDPTYTATEDGTYSVDLVNLFGCESYDETVVEIECLPRIVAPNAFRPDGEVNPDFFIYTFFIDDAPFEVFIFSRWGELVYQSVERQFKWNGSYNNNAAKPLPPGTYSYVVRYRSSYRPEDGIQEKRGGVVLLR